MTEDEPMEVSRVTVREVGGTSSRVEPPLDPLWSDKDKLRWHAGVLLADVGIRVKISEFPPQRPREIPTFCVYGLGWGYSATSFQYCWTYINGLSRGAELMRKGQA